MSAQETQEITEYWHDAYSVYMDKKACTELFWSRIHGKCNKHDECLKNTFSQHTQNNTQCHLGQRDDESVTVTLCHNTGISSD